MSFIKNDSSIIENYNEITDKRISEILATKTEISVRSKAYFVSCDGNDDNDGLTPETAWKSINRVYLQKLEYGDAVLFKRGDIFRFTTLDDYAFSMELRKNDLFKCGILLTSGVTYSSYGEGAKPVLLYSIDACGADNWLKTEEENIWKLRVPLSLDVGCIHMNDDNNWVCGVKVMWNNEHTERHFIGDVYNGIEHYYAENTVTNEKYLINHDLEFFHSVDDDGLYFYSGKGNPGDRFDKLEIIVNMHGFWFDANDVLIDNIEINGAGGHGVATANTENFTIQNSVFKWIGGSVQPRTRVGTVRFGNAVENWSACKNFKILNCYASQVYDCCWTVQAGEAHDFIDIEVRGNVTEYANNGLEVWMPGGTLKDMTLTNNITRYAGYGWSNQRPNKDGNFFYGGTGGDKVHFENNNCCGNIGFMTYCYVLFARNVGPNADNFHDNIYIVEDGKYIGCMAENAADGTGKMTRYSYDEGTVNMLQESGVEKGSTFYCVDYQNIKGFEKK